MTNHIYTRNSFVFRQKWQWESKLLRVEACKSRKLTRKPNNARNLFIFRKTRTASFSIRNDSGNRNYSEWRPERDENSLVKMFHFLWQHKITYLLSHYAPSELHGSPQCPPHSLKQAFNHLRGAQTQTSIQILRSFMALHSVLHTPSNKHSIIYEGCVQSNKHSNLAHSINHKQFLDS